MTRHGCLYTKSRKSHQPAIHVLQNSIVLLRGYVGGRGSWLPAHRRRRPFRRVFSVWSTSSLQSPRLCVSVISAGRLVTARRSRLDEHYLHITVDDCTGILSLKRITSPRFCFGSSLFRLWTHLTSRHTYWHVNHHCFPDQSELVFSNQFCYTVSKLKLRVKCAEAPMLEHFPEFDTRYVYHS